MWKYNSKKRSKYYDEVIRLYTQEGMGRCKISKIFPIGESTISRWIRNFADENPTLVVMRRKKIVIPEPPVTSNECSNAEDPQAEITRLKKELANQMLYVDALNELINVAEKQFNISIRKKTGAKQ